MAGKARKLRVYKERCMKAIEKISQRNKEILKTPLEASDLRTLNTVADLRKIDKVIEVIEQSKNGNIELEDADFEFLKERFSNFTAWRPQVRKDVMEVDDKLREVK